MSYDEQLEQAIEDLEFDLLVKDPIAYGVAMQVVHRGYELLSFKKRHIYDTRVAPLLEEQAMKNEIERRMSRDDLSSSFNCSLAGSRIWQRRWRVFDRRRDGA